MNKELIKQLGIALKTIKSQAEQTQIYHEFLKEGIKPHRAFLLTLTFQLSNVEINQDTLQ